MPGATMLDRDRTALLVVDVQEGFRPVIDGFDEVAANTAKLVEGARVLGLPVIVTEQYPKGLGRTVPEVGLTDAEQPLEKTVFAAPAAEGFDLQGRDQVVVCGIETHICVHQSVAALREQGVEVQVASDAVGSRRAENKALGLERAVEAGGKVTSVEMALFELLGAAGSDEFKQIQRLIK
jgi:nicotinamidase-related amidase